MGLYSKVFGQDVAFASCFPSLACYGLEASLDAKVLGC